MDDRRNPKKNLEILEKYYQIRKIKIKKNVWSLKCTNQESSQDGQTILLNKEEEEIDTFRRIL